MHTNCNELQKPYRGRREAPPPMGRRRRWRLIIFQFICNFSVFLLALPVYVADYFSCVTLLFRWFRPLYFVVILVVGVPTTNSIDSTMFLFLACHLGIKKIKRGPLTPSKISPKISKTDRSLYKNIMKTHTQRGACFARAPFPRRFQFLFMQIRTIFLIFVLIFEGVGGPRLIFLIGKPSGVRKKA